MTPLPLHEKKALLSWIEGTFGIPIKRLEPLLLFKKGRDIWMASPQLQEIALPSTTRAGARLARQDRRSYRLTTPAIQLLGRWATRRVVEITTQEGERYIRGEDLTLDSPPSIPRGQVIVRVHGRPLGSGLLEGEGIKNQIPVAQRVRKVL
ncbi:MAG: hypothetical protein DRI92_03985 [Aquificota bacterium]|nr:MAG: hypothetical protein DRI92_03985 [Aquificota bacterium]